MFLYTVNLTYTFEYYLLYRRLFFSWQAEVTTSTKRIQIYCEEKNFHHMRLYCPHVQVTLTICIVIFVFIRAFFCMKQKLKFLEILAMYI